jgi:methylmalonyl-CoA mutase N-terminal domain/subunit
VRVTLQALAAVLGGCQSLHTNSRDEALALPTENAVLLALRTQQIIAHESGVSDTMDPMGGSYYVESLTDEIEKRVLEFIKKIDDLGGAVRAIEQQFYQTQIAESAYKYQIAIERKEKIIVGVNEFVSSGENIPLTLHIDEGVRERQIQRLRAVKASRDQQRVEKALEQLQAIARTDRNIVPHLLDTVESYATIGEISDALRNVWGEYNP